MESEQTHKPCESERMKKIWDRARRILGVDSVIEIARIHPSSLSEDEGRKLNNIAHEMTSLLKGLKGKHMKTTLVEFESWSVCETDDDKFSGVKGKEVFAEHFRDCNDDTNPKTSSWGWEFDDPLNDDGREVCWKCATPVPEEVVALVQLHNWGRTRREP